MTISTQPNELQSFHLGAQLVISGRTFTVEKLGDPALLRPHLLVGPRGAHYFLLAYLDPRTAAPLERFFITNVMGIGTPLRGKNGRRLEVYIFGDLLSEAH